MKILNIYAQDSEHTEARIVGNRDGLLALQMAIVRALVDPGAQVDPHPDQEPLFASDGEGFDVIVERHDDHWGIVDGTGKEDPNSFWAKPESEPQYLYKERAVGDEVADFGKRLADVFDKCRDSHVFFFLQQAFPENKDEWEWAEYQKLLNRILDREEKTDVGS